MNFWLFALLTAAIIVLAELFRRSRQGTRARRLAVTGLEVGCISYLVGTLVYSAGVRSFMRTARTPGADSGEYFGRLDSAQRLQHIGFWISSASGLAICICFLLFCYFTWKQHTTK